LRNEQIAMTHLLAIRLNPANPDHHLWNNNGTWFVHYTIHPTPFTKQRIRASLGTKDKLQARVRRDQLLIQPVAANA
jgi:hypothetical protein